MAVGSQLRGRHSDYSAIERVNLVLSYNRMTYDKGEVISWPASAMRFRLFLAASAVGWCVCVMAAFGLPTGPMR